MKSVWKYRLLNVSQILFIQWWIILMHNDVYHICGSICKIFVLDQAVCFPLQWRHNEHDGVSNQRRIKYLPNRLFRRRSKKTPKFCVAGLCEGNPLVTGAFLSQRASNAEKVSIWWCHNVFLGWSRGRLWVWYAFPRYITVDIWANLMIFALKCTAWYNGKLITLWMCSEALPGYRIFFNFWAAVVRLVPRLARLFLPPQMTRGGCLLSRVLFCWYCNIR